MNLGDARPPQETAMHMINEYGIREASNWAWHYHLNSKDRGNNENEAMYWEAVWRWINTQQRRAPYWRRTA